MAIGVNWKEIWANVWKAVWDPSNPASTYTTSLEHGTYTFTGQDALIDYALNLDFGTYSISGQDITFSQTSPDNYTEDLNHGVYTITGRPVNTVYSGAPVVSTGAKVVGLKMSIGV